MSQHGAEPRLLVVEDESNLAAALKLNFEFEGYHVDVACSGKEAGRLLMPPSSYRAIVLDVMLPDIDGFTFCQKLRETGNYTPVLMLTALGGIDERVNGLQAGADDYLAKPFELSELLARVASLLRRHDWERARLAQPKSELRFGSVQVDFDTQQVHVADKQLRLTRLELDLLRYFAQNPDRVLTRQELQEKVWQVSGEVNTRMVDNFIMRLRRHFEPDPADPVFFVSMRGTGYKFVPLAQPKSRER